MKSFIARLLSPLVVLAVGAAVVLRCIPEAGRDQAYATTGARI